MLFILSSIYAVLEFWSVNHTSIYENFGSDVFKNVKFLSEISNNWPKDLLRTKLYTRLVNFVDNYYWQYCNKLIPLH